MEVAIVLLILAAVFAVWGLISPVGMWNATQSWRFKNPEANRPSEAQHTMTRVGSGICLVSVAILIPSLIQMNKQTQRQQEEDRYRDCLAERRGSDGLLSPEQWCENLAPDDEATDSDGYGSGYDSSTYLDSNEYDFSY